MGAFDKCAACRFALKLERLRRMRPKQPHYLDRKLGGRMAPGWNLMVPAPILAGEWEKVTR